MGLASSRSGHSPCVKAPRTTNEWPPNVELRAELEGNILDPQSPTRGQCHQGLIGKTPSPQPKHTHSCFRHAPEHETSDSAACKLMQFFAKSMGLWCGKSLVFNSELSGMAIAMLKAASQPSSPCGRCEPINNFAMFKTYSKLVTLEIVRRS